MLAVSVIGAVYFLVPLFIPGYAFHLLSEARVIRRPQRPELRRQYATRRIAVMSECGCCGSSLPVQSLTKRRRYVWSLSLLAICAGFLLAFLTHAVLLFGLSDHLVFELVYVVVALVLAAVLLASAQTLKGRRFLSHCGLSWTMILTIAAWCIYAVVIPTATLLYEFLAPPEAQIKPLGISALLLLVPIINWVIYQSGRKKTWNRVGGLTVVAISLLLGWVPSTISPISALPHSSWAAWKAKPSSSPPEDAASSGRPASSTNAGSRRTTTAFTAQGR